MPWEPEPGRFNIEVKSMVQIPKDDKEIVKALEVSDREVIKRRIKITKWDVRTYDGTPHCRGCSAVIAGDPVAKNHTEPCRGRFMKIFEDNEDKRISTTKESLVEKLEVISAPEGTEEEPETSDYEGVYNMMLNLTADDDTAAKLTSKVCQVKNHSNNIKAEIEKMNEALTKEGFSHSIMEMYSPPCLVF